MQWEGGIHAEAENFRLRIQYNDLLFLLKKDDISSYSKMLHYQRYSLIIFSNHELGTDISPHDLSVHLIHPSIHSSYLPLSLPSFHLLFFFSSCHAHHPSMHLFIHISISLHIYPSVHLPPPPFLLSFLPSPQLSFSPACHPHHPSTHSFIIPCIHPCFHPSICSTYSGPMCQAHVLDSWPPSG